MGEGVLNPLSWEMTHCNIWMMSLWEERGPSVNNHEFCFEATLNFLNACLKRVFQQCVLEVENIFVCTLWEASQEGSPYPFLGLPCYTSPVNEAAVDLWSNTNVMEIPCTYMYSPSLLNRSKLILICNFERFRHKQGLYVDGIPMALVLDHWSTA